MNTRIIKIRENAGLTQQEFADKLKVAQSTVAGYERGTRQPKELFISKVCDEFSINEEWLKTGKGDMIKQISPEEKTYARFGKVMEKGSAMQKNMLSMLLAMVEILPEEEWNKIYEEFKESKARSGQEKSED